MKTRRDFLKTIIAAGIGLGFGALGHMPFESKAGQESGQAVRPAHTACVWRRTIFCQFRHAGLEAEIRKCAERIGCLVYPGKPSSPDIVAIPSLVAIVDRNITGAEYWSDYVRFCDETHDDVPCIIVDERKDLELPQTKLIVRLNPDERGSVEKIIGMVAEMKRLMDGSAARLSPAAVSTGRQAWA